MTTVDELAQIIRQVDGNHSLGAGALAEAIIAKLPHIAARQPVTESMVNRARYAFNMAHDSGKDQMREALTAAALPAQAVGEVVVTKNEQGQIVCVTRQDDEHRILSVIAESDPVGQEPVAVAYGPISLPPVPHGQVMPPDDRTGLYPVAHDDEAMQDYAREAVEADRAQLAAGVAHIKGAFLIDGTVHLVRKGDEIDWANGSVDGRKGRLLYSAPPAQAVDLGQFRQPVQDWLDDAQASMEEHGDYDGVFGHAIEEGTRLLALIDSQAVGK